MWQRRIMRHSSDVIFRWEPNSFLSHNCCETRSVILRCKWTGCWEEVIGGSLFGLCSRYRQGVEMGWVCTTRVTSWNMLNFTYFFKLDLCVCLLKKNAESSWECVASNDRVLVTSEWERIFKEAYVVKYKLMWESNINSQLYATITNFIDNYNQLNMFRAIISPILGSTRLCLQLVV